MLAREVLYSSIEEKLLDIAGKRYDSRKNPFDNYYCYLIQFVVIRLFFCFTLNIIYKMIRPKNYSTFSYESFDSNIACLCTYIYVSFYKPRSLRDKNTIKKLFKYKSQITFCDYVSYCDSSTDISSSFVTFAKIIITEGVFLMQMQ